MADDRSIYADNLDPLANADQIMALHSGKLGNLGLSTLSTLLASTGALASVLEGKARLEDLLAATTRIAALEGRDFTTPNPKPPVDVATTGNITLSGEQVLDGVLTSTSRVLVRNQSDASENGVYLSASGAWARAVDMDEDAEIPWATVYVEGGDTLAGTRWIANVSSLTLDTDDMPWVKYDGNPDELTPIEGLEGRVANIEEATVHLAFYEGTDIYPIAADRSGKVVLGYTPENEIVGPGLASAVTATTAQTGEEPLPSNRRIVAAEYNHVEFYGQSLGTGTTGLPVISAAQPYGNVTFSGGPRVWDGSTFDDASLIPLVEVSSQAEGFAVNVGETPCSGTANMASTLRAQRGEDPADHIILASAAGRGGYSLDELEKGTPWYADRFVQHVSSAHALESDHAVQMVGWVHGEGDTTSGTTRATYTAGVQGLISDFQTDASAITGQTHAIHWVTNQSSRRTTTNDGVALAIYDLTESEEMWLACPTYFLPYDGDETHLTATGYKWMAGYFGRAYDAISRGVKPRWLHPKSAVIRGDEVRVSMRAPSGDLSFDTSTISAITDMGFVVEEDGTPVTISTVAIDGTDVVLTLSSAPTGALAVRYALDNEAASVVADAAGAGNLRDNAAETIWISGAQYSLHNWCIAFEKSITYIGE